MTTRMSAPCDVPRPAGANRGFTLWELLYAMTLAGVLLGLGIPPLRAVVLDAQRRNTANALLSAVRFARTEAQKRGRTISLCSSVDLETCADAGVAATGWIVFERADGGAPAARAPTARLLLAGRAARRTVLATNREAFELRPFPRRSTNGTIALCDERGAARSRAVIISYTGRPRLGDGASAMCETVR